MSPEDSANGNNRLAEMPIFTTRRLIQTVVVVFIRDNNVWLANPDGSGQYQVTLDGSAGSPYESPSQSDAGTIMAIRQPAGGRNQLWRMSQSGGLLNTPINTPAPGPAGAAEVLGI